MRSISLLLACGILSAVYSIAVAAEKTEVKTVEWYMQEENKPALEATLKKCKNNPGELEDDPNCENAALAEHKLFFKQASSTLATGGYYEAATIGNAS